MKKLRLLLFKDCKRNCSGCCNKDWDLKSLKKVKSFKGYDEIILTGGEPMLKPAFVIGTALKIRSKTNAKIYMYTANVDDVVDVLAVLFHIDGVTVTLHEQNDVLSFWYLNKILLKYNIIKSFRLNVFKGISLHDVDLSLWNVKTDIEWIKNCPLPKGEVFKKY